MNGFINHLYTRLVSTSNYSAIDDLHILQIAVKHTHTRTQTQSVLSLLLGVSLQWLQQ
jgi:hypothetical protein